MMNHSERSADHGLFSLIRSVFKPNASASVPDTAPAPAGAVPHTHEVFAALSEQFASPACTLSPAEIAEEISAAFTRRVEAVGEHRKEDRIDVKWANHLRFAARYTDVCPRSLLEYITAENYRCLSSLLNSFRNTICEEPARSNFLRFARLAHQRILDEIAPDDAPSHLFMGNCLLNEHDFEGARAHYWAMIESGSDYHGITALSSAYEREIRWLLDRKYNDENADSRKIDRRIRDINIRLSDLYGTWTQKYRALIPDAPDEKTRRELQLRYASLTAKYARNAKCRGNYHKCHSILTDHPMDGPGTSRIMTELGLLFQTPGNRHRPNPYYDPHGAIEMLDKALHALEAETPDAQKGSSQYRGGQKSILVPLANTYYACGQYAQAIRICDKVLALDKREEKAIQLKAKAEASAKQSA